ncbi:MAG TPA: exopolyphosphatase, partial [Acidimicrobiales bacterium]|nr:exopolyphosphatase [Acidimicrobiales bacterium]
PADLVPQHVVVLGGSRTVVESTAPPGDVTVEARPGPSVGVPAGDTVRAPIGTIIGARSGDKGGNANLGVFARTDEAWSWLDSFLTAERLAELLPEAAPLRIDRHRLASIRSLNFVIHGLLEEGVAASTRKDPQAKSLGEWLRARHVDIPAALLEGR